MRVLCVIPARVGSTRLPEKPLQPLWGQPLIRVVARQALDFEFFDHIVVATDDERVVRAVAELDVEPVLTSSRPRNGTERVAEVLRMSRFARAEVVVNLQGDEPCIPKAAVTGAVQRVWGGAGVGTAGAPLAEPERFSADVVKVFVDGAGDARGFSRRPGVPAGVGDDCAVLRHVGVYAYPPPVLARWVATPPVQGELGAGLEQLRPLSYGERIAVMALIEEVPPGIDTEEDLRVTERLGSQLFTGWVIE